MLLQTEKKMTRVFALFHGKAEEVAIFKRRRDPLLDIDHAVRK